MSLKNKRLRPLIAWRPFSFAQKQTYSLRMRLALWYSGLLALTLVLFALLVLITTSNILDQDAEREVLTEAQIVATAMRRQLLPKPPYWPGQFSINVFSTYQAPGVWFEVMDAQGGIRYDSDANPSTYIPISTGTIKAVRAGQECGYDTTMGGESIPVEVEAMPIYAPSSKNLIIGTLLVAKSLSEGNKTIQLLQVSLLFFGGAALLGALLGGWMIASRVLNPLAEIAKTARSIAAVAGQGKLIGNLSLRVRRPGGRDEMVQVVDAFNEMLTNLERATQVQHRFVADASHELRAPLTTIQGNLAFLQQHADDVPLEEQRVMLADAYGETLRLSQLVEELLFLARADASGQSEQLAATTAVGGPILSEDKANYVPVELDRVVLQLVRQLRVYLSTTDANVRLEVAHIEPVRVRGEEELIRRILRILLDNAIKYTLIKTDQDEGCVTISLERTAREGLLCVQDSGIGIEAADLPHIFERFYRADRARSRQGTGLGLAIAQTLVTQLGGRITAESTPGQGSTFKVWFPLLS
jgi:two-component system OmpR family sensor kinase